MSNEAVVAHGFPIFNSIPTVNLSARLYHLFVSIGFTLKVFPKECSADFDTAVIFDAGAGHIINRLN